MRQITGDEVAEWHRSGFVVVSDFLSTDELAEAREGFHLIYPTAEEHAADRDRYASLVPMREFPFGSDALNLLTTSEELLDLVGSQLGTSDVFVTQALLWAKYGSTGDLEQSLHRDYGNNTLVVPRDEGIFRQVPMILYYSDVTIDMGPTFVLTQEVGGAEPLVPLQRTRDERPDLYESEVPVTVTAGSLLLYTMQTLHRGSRFISPDGARFSHHIVWRAAGFEWMGFRSFPREGNDPAMARFLSRATPRQRAAVGFPAVGHAYWTTESIAGVNLRYPEMDMEPYRAALAASTTSRSVRADS